MFGNKLRSLMEAVRPKKKHSRKEKQSKIKNGKDPSPPQIMFSFNTNRNNNIAEEHNTQQIQPELSSNDPLNQPEPTSSRYSVANLSSPESAYSTGYSTDGTSPGAPPEYYKEPKTKMDITVAPRNSPIDLKTQVSASPLPERPLMNTTHDVASPRQRNRIRTNPWLLNGSTTSNTRPWPNTCNPGLSEPKLFNHSFSCVTTISKPRRRSISSSSCSSLSGAETYWDGSEDDRTLNEMMGKYDESYVYEKETDILSDSEPTDLDTDIDTGQDGGDELEQQEGDMFYIDDGSFIETTSIGKQNTGHCSYFNFQEKRKAPRRKTTRKSKHKSSSHKKSTSAKITEPTLPPFFKSDGSRSLGATPLFARRTGQLPISKLALEEKLSKRSNSVHLYRDPIATIDKKDEEADQKYEELIVEAEHILRNIKTEGLSPRRLPGPANKRVELLRSAECTKTARVGDVPSTNIASLRLLPRSSLSTSIPGYMLNNSPPRSPFPARKLSDRHYHSPKYKRKSSKMRKEITSSSSEDEKTEIRVPPQSEPLKRKVYISGGKNMPIYSNNYSGTPQHHRNSAESLRHQVLINTIANLKKNLEDQSASLKQAYRSPKRCPPCI